MRAKFSQSVIEKVGGVSIESEASKDVLPVMVDQEISFAKFINISHGNNQHTTISSHRYGGNKISVENQQIETHLSMNG
jgi:hypothetical protein